MKKINMIMMGLMLGASSLYAQPKFGPETG